MNRRSPLHAALWFQITLLLSAPLTADTITLSGKPPFEGVTLIGMAHGRIAFRGLSGETIRRPIAMVESIAVDRLPPLATAEQAAGQKNWDAAIPAYQAALSAAPDPWLRDLVRLRLYYAAESAAHAELSCSIYIELTKSPQTNGPTAPPACLAAAGMTDLRKAQQLVADAIVSKDGTAFIRDQLRPLAVELLLLTEGDIPREWCPTASTIPTSRPAATSSPETEDAPPPLMFGDKSPTKHSPPTTQFTSVRLRAGSPVLERARRLIATDPDQAARLLDRVEQFLDESDLPAARLLLAKAHLPGDPARAADELLGVATAEADRARQADALYYVGLAHERLDRPDVAAQVYRELLERDDLPTELRERVRQRLAALPK